MTIALCIRTKLDREVKDLGIDEKCKIEIVVQEGKHETKEEIDKQVADKERVMAAMEQDHIKSTVEGLISNRNIY